MSKTNEPFLNINKNPGRKESPTAKAKPRINRSRPTSVIHRPKPYVGQVDDLPTANFLPACDIHNDDGTVVHVPAEICPFLMTFDEAARYLRIGGFKDPKAILAKYREEGLLRGTKIGTEICYLHPELVNFLHLLTKKQPK